MHKHKIVSLFWIRKKETREKELSSRHHWKSKRDDGTDRSIYPSLSSSIFFSCESYLRKFFCRAAIHVGCVSVNRQKNTAAKQKANVLNWICVLVGTAFSVVLSTFCLSDQNRSVLIVTFIRLIEINRTNWRIYNSFDIYKSESIVVNIDWNLKSGKGESARCHKHIFNAYRCTHCISFHKINTDKLRFSTSAKCQQRQKLTSSGSFFYVSCCELYLLWTSILPK